MTNNNAYAASLPLWQAASSYLRWLIVVLTLPISQIYAGNARWGSNPLTTDWNTTSNWSPATVPNGPTDTATFATSSKTMLSISANTEVNGVTFNANASGYGISVAGFGLTISGAGISNNSVPSQGFHTQLTYSTGIPGAIYFLNSATAGTGTNYINDGPIIGQTLFAYTELFNSSTLGSATMNNNGSLAVGYYGGATYFYDTATAGQGTINNNPGLASGAY